MEEKANNEIVDRKGEGDTGSSTYGRSARFAYCVSCVSVIWFLSLAALRAGEGAPIKKNDGSARRTF